MEYSTQHRMLVEHCTVKQNRFAWRHVIPVGARYAKLDEFVVRADADAEYFNDALFRCVKAIGRDLREKNHAVDVLLQMNAGRVHKCQRRFSPPLAFARVDGQSHRDLQDPQFVRRDL